MSTLTWNSPEAYVNLDSDGAAVVRVLLGRDDRSVHALVPDPQVDDRGFHEVTLVATHGRHGRAGCVCRRPICASADVAGTDHGQFVVVTAGA